MTVAADENRTLEALAESLYHRSISGQGRHDAPTWTALPYEMRSHWRDIARAALTFVRQWDDTT